jgi:hypothetical protein
VRADWAFAPVAKQPEASIIIILRKDFTPASTYFVIYGLIFVESALFQKKCINPEHNAWH